MLTAAAGFDFSTPSPSFEDVAELNLNVVTALAVPNISPFSGLPLLSLNQLSNIQNLKLPPQLIGGIPDMADEIMAANPDMPAILLAEVPADTQADKPSKRASPAQRKLF